jgi:hypothetical protein
MCSISREPRRDDQTTCTAVAPDFIFTVRAYGTGPFYGRPGRARAATRQPAGLPGNSRSRTLVTRPEDRHQAKQAAVTSLAYRAR